MGYNDQVLLWNDGASSDGEQDGMVLINIGDDYDLKPSIEVLRVVDPGGKRVATMPAHAVEEGSVVRSMRDYVCVAISAGRFTEDILASMSDRAIRIAGKCVRNVFEDEAERRTAATRAKIKASGAPSDDAQIESPVVSTDDDTPFF
jgi:hypothetical protein